MGVTFLRVKDFLSISIYSTTADTTTMESCNYFFHITVVGGAQQFALLHLHHLHLSKVFSNGKLHHFHNSYLRTYLRNVTPYTRKTLTTTRIQASHHMIRNGTHTPGDRRCPQEYFPTRSMRAKGSGSHNTAPMSRPNNKTGR